jgi:hypothetical protein
MVRHDAWLGRMGKYSVAPWFTGFEVKLKATSRLSVALIHLPDSQDFAEILPRNKCPQFM